MFICPIYLFLLLFSTIVFRRLILYKYKAIMYHILTNVDVPWIYDTTSLFFS